MRHWSAHLTRVTAGIGLVVIGVLALAAPFAVGTWSLQFLGLPMLAVAMADLYQTLASPRTRTHPASYVTSILATAAALVLYLSPSLVASGVVAIFLTFLVVDGVVKASQAVFGPPSGTSRTVAIVNGLSSFMLALIGFWVWKTLGLQIALGVAVAGYAASAGWRLLVAPTEQRERDHTSDATNKHPDNRLNLGSHELFAAGLASRASSAPIVGRTELQWLMVVGAVLFVVHLARMESSDTWLGLISPVVATVGDVLMAILFGALLVLPLRLGWRLLTRPFERIAWRLRFSGQDVKLQALPRRLVRGWTDARLSFAASLRDARSSLSSAVGLTIRLGLPLTVLFVAVNTIWGFTWYFNTESWASAFYQKMAELRVDTWRAGMVDGVLSAYGGKIDKLFRVAPPGIDDQDFSFIVIGDPGEGDASQYALIERYLEIGRRDDVKFLIIASDVIYPAGAMADYEKNFHLPFKGFKKPIYAIPGNHDWFDALEGFNANFLEPQAARAALAARADTDLNLTSTGTNRIDRLVDRAQRLRELYGIQNGLQRGPFFEIQTADFALIAIDTGILRTIDDRQRAWLTDALARARGKFTMVIPGHPKYAGGTDTSTGDDAFSALFATLENAGVDVVMAGDTHAFEFYVQNKDVAGGARPIYHFVNGGGGAYLSIGGALGWPDVLPVETWAFYPGPDAVRAKLDTETPAWKQPVWAWIKRFGAWPVSTETLSGIFDFNHAPFYQSFVEVRVERSRKRVVFALQAANGPVRWQDLHASFKGVAGMAPDAPVEFIVNMKAPGG
ncbi:metallophosphoesterase [Bradyrhizobium sp. 2S1]|uniref:metallophosphoesterase n=1 Tax=Bradyrhizobium sp. 2S1 TaxID=1404429 RepID=UPI001408D02E|nr:metallophosphoesterase [Bradyrhizobium sp. 2S1]MCK7665349.1 metallophosphoesterase [Bradyrhizobium sp. 2S1]